MDRGIKIADVAKMLTPEQTGELLAIKLNSIATDRPIPIMATHRHDDDLGPLIDQGLVDWRVPPAPWNRSAWKLPVITAFGELVLLARAETAMLATKALAWPEGCPE